MPKKLNFLGGMQNYNEHTGEYEPALTGANGQVVKDADGDGKAHEGERDFNDPKQADRYKEQERDFNLPNKHDYSQIFDEDYQRSYGIPNFKDETDIKKLNDIVEKAMEYDGEEGAIDISNNAMERIGELTTFTEEEQDKLASGTGEEIMEILRSKESKKEDDELQPSGYIDDADKVALVPDLIDKGYSSDEAHNILFEARDEIVKSGKDVDYKSLKEYIDKKQPKVAKEQPKQKAPTYQKGVPGEDYNFYEDGNFSVKHRSPNSSFEEASVMYEGLNKFYGYDLETMVYGEDGFMKEKYPNGFPDFKGDILYSSKHWDEFEDWAKDKYGIDFEQIRKDNFEEYKKTKEPNPSIF